MNLWAKILYLIIEEVTQNRQIMGVNMEGDLENGKYDQISLYLILKELMKINKLTLKMNHRNILNGWIQL